MKKVHSIRALVALASGAVVLLFGLFGVARSQQSLNAGPGPDLLPPAFQHQVGDPVAGKTVFRYETFGNQGFWTDAMQLPQGIAAAGLTPASGLTSGPERQRGCPECGYGLRLLDGFTTGAIGDGSQ